MIIVIIIITLPWFYVSKALHILIHKSSFYLLSTSKPVTPTFPIISTSNKYILNTYSVPLNAINIVVNKKTDILMRRTISK